MGISDFVRKEFAEGIMAVLLAIGISFGLIVMKIAGMRENKNV